MNLPFTPSSSSSLSLTHSNFNFFQDLVLEENTVKFIAIGLSEEEFVRDS